MAKRGGDDAGMDRPRRRTGRGAAPGLRAQPGQSFARVAILSTLLLLAIYTAAAVVRLRHEPQTTTLANAALTPRAEALAARLDTEAVSLRGGLLATRDLLQREVDHRARNMLSVVQSIIQLTRAGSLAAYKDLVLGRISALARAHGSLAQRHWEGGPLGAVVELELAALGKDQAHRISGPEIILTPEKVQPFSMILHELGTNACKYGALGVEAGQVSVDWALTPEGGVRLVWQERGGPPVHAPTRRGFGSRLIHDLARQLGGEARFHWETAGLRVEILSPLG